MRRLMPTASVLLCALGLTAASVLAVPVQSPASPPTELPKGSGLLMGQVVDARGAGVAGAVVALNGGFEAVALQVSVRPLPGGVRRTLTNAAGRFVFFDLPKGSYSIEASKPGYLPGAFGRRRHGGPAQSVVLADGERNTQIKFAMWEYAAITGTLVDEAGEPLVGVPVRALARVIDAGLPRWDTTTGLAATSDDRGEYRIDRLAPGEYLVAVASTQTTLPRSLVEAAAAERAAGTGTGTLTTQLIRNGASGAISSASAVRYSGDWAWATSTRSVLTVPNFLNDGRTFAYPTTFYPAARGTSDARSIVLASGEERTGVDLHLQLVPAAPVSGIVTGPEGPVPGLAVRLVPDYQPNLTAESSLDAALTVTDAAGRFMFYGVAPGSYLVRAQAAAGTGIGVAPNAPAFRGLWVNQTLNVGENGVSDVAIVLRGGSKVTGRVEFDGALPKPAPDLVAKFMVRLEADDPKAFRSQTDFRAPVDRNGQFTIPEVPPGKYYVIFLAYLEDRRAMPGWETKGATLGGKDVATRPMDVQEDVNGVVMTITDHPSELSGTARDAMGRADAGAAVVLFTVERDLWTHPGGSNRRMRSVRASESGAFSFRGVPEGEYFIAAIPDEDSTDWQELRVMEMLAQNAVRLRIADGEKKTQDLTTKRIR